MASSKSNTEQSKEDAISRVLDTFVKRLAFVNLQYLLEQDTSIDFALSQLPYENTQIEPVGSSQDGLKVGKVFDAGDVDIILYSNTVSFNSADESSFEYRKEDPSFLYIPQPKLLSNLSPVDGKYLNANYLRNRHPEIFKTKSKKTYRYVPFPILPFTTSTGSLKCAATYSVSYSDPEFNNERQAPELSVDHRLFITWVIEHVLFTYLLMSRNRDKIDFVKALLYGCDASTDIDTKTELKNHMIKFKQDFQRNMFVTFDMLFFKSSTFVEVISSATDPAVLSTLKEASRRDPHSEYSIDLVPAIRCEGWPVPAHTFRTRERKWPPEQIVENIIKQGYQVVAKPPDTDPHPDKDFLLSFSPAEKQIANALPVQAKLAYCLLKLCFKSAKEQILTESLKTFHLKTALFWVAEEIDQHAWADNGLLWGIRSIASYLIDSLRKRNLPSYFVQTNNLIRHFSVVDSERAMKAFQLIHDNPANFIQLVIEKKLKSSRAGLPEDSGYYDKFSWLELIKSYCRVLGSSGNYPFDAIMDNMTKQKSDSLYAQIVSAPFREPQSGNIQSDCHITDDQLKYVEIFLQTVTKMEMDLFNVLDGEVEEDIVQSVESWLPKETLDLYPQYDPKSDEKFGEHFLAMLRLRLKFYENIFHVICTQLMESRFKQTQTVKNQDALYIINFLNELTQRRSFTEENIEDLLHFMLYFCHFTRLRHHALSFDEQILRSMREFLQDTKHMMTVYFNPREIYPMPVDLNDKIDTLLGEGLLLLL